MKNILFLAAFLLFAGVAFSQTDTMMNDTSMHKGMKGMHGMGKMKDCVMMHDGKVMVMKGGQHMPLTQQMTLSNGATVTADGTVKMSDGSTKMLKEGECIYMDGTMGKMPGKGKMKMQKDSTSA